MASPYNKIHFIFRNPVTKKMEALKLVVVGDTGVGIKRMPHLLLLHGLLPKYGIADYDRWKDYQSRFVGYIMPGKKLHF